MNPNDTFYANLSDDNTDCNLFLQMEPPIRNPNHWAAALDFTCCCINSHCTAVSPTVAMCANHFRASIGDSLDFVDNDNTVTTVRVTDIANVVGTDIAFLQLDTQLPETIKPATFINQIYVAPGNQTLAVWCNQFHTVHIFGLKIIGDILSGDVPATHAELYTPVVNFDSGCPWFYITDSGFAILTSTSNPGAGPFYLGLQIPSWFL